MATNTRNTQLVTCQYCWTVGHDTLDCPSIDMDAYASELAERGNKSKGLHYVDTGNGQAVCGANVFIGASNTTMSHDNVTCAMCKRELETPVDGQA